MSIAACLMVRDEAEFLRACLSSLEGQVDAIYVTDTGSRDESAAVARSFGATVRSFPWRNDFAAGRNASIADVSEDWILVLDADDVLPPGEAARIRERLDSEACAATLCYSVQADYTPVRSVKILRNGLGAAFEGVIHENVGAWLSLQMTRGWKRQDLDLTVIHTGYVPAAMPGKVSRNLPLLDAEWLRGSATASPERRCHIGAELGLALAYSDRRPEARQFLSRLLEEFVSDKGSIGATTPDSALQVLINLLWVLSEEGLAEEALSVAQTAEKAFGSTLAYCLHRGLAELAIGHYADALEWLERFRNGVRPGSIEVPVPSEYLGSGIWRALGLCHMGKRQYREATDCFQRCVALDPGNPEHELRLLVAQRTLAQ